MIDGHLMISKGLASKSTKIWGSGVIVHLLLSPYPTSPFPVSTSPDCLDLVYRISANSFRGNYSFLNLALFTVTFDLYFINLNSCRGNYSREETIQGRKLFAEIRYTKSKQSGLVETGNGDVG